MKKIFVILLVSIVLFYNTVSAIVTNGLSTESDAQLNKGVTETSLVKEKRGSTTFDTVMGSDGWFHFRVFFWVPKTATHLTPYADKGVKTDVSDHGTADKWSVVETGTSNDNEKLVFVYVPKRFVFLFGFGFEKVIHLTYEQ